jgi:hypothetical protein
MVPGLCSLLVSTAERRVLWRLQSPKAVSLRTIIRGQFRQNKFESDPEKIHRMKQSYVVCCAHSVSPLLPLPLPHILTRSRSLTLLLPLPPTPTPTASRSHSHSLPLPLPSLHPYPLTHLLSLPRS